MTPITKITGQFKDYLYVADSYGAHALKVWLRRRGVVTPVMPVFEFTIKRRIYDSLEVSILTLEVSILTLVIGAVNSGLRWPEHGRLLMRSREQIEAQFAPSAENSVPVDLGRQLYPEAFFAPDRAPKSTPKSREIYQIAFNSMPAEKGEFADGVRVDGKTHEIDLAISVYDELIERL